MFCSVQEPPHMRCRRRPRAQGNTFTEQRFTGPYSRSLSFTAAQARPFFTAFSCCCWEKCDTKAGTLRPVVSLLSQLYGNATQRLRADGSGPCSEQRSVVQRLQFFSLRFKADMRKFFYYISILQVNLSVPIECSFKAIDLY